MLGSVSNRLPPPVLYLGDVMKGGKPLAELQEKYTINGHCIVCGAGFQFPYGRWHVEGELQSGTCSKSCEAKQESTNALLHVFHTVPESVGVGGA